MTKTNNYVKTFINPGGFVEQDYVGTQTPQQILRAIDQLVDYSKKLKSQDKPLLILVDISRVTTIDLSRRTLNARLAGIKAMRSVGYKKAAVCGPLPIQVLVRSLSLVAGVHTKVHVFDNRVEAVRWLRAK